MNSLDLPSITAAGRPIIIDPTDKARPYQIGRAHV